MTRILNFRRSERPSTEAIGDEPSQSWLDRPLNGWSCTLGWLIAFGVFVALTTLLGGLTQLDALLSTYSAWFMAHGNFACAYPPGSSVQIALTAPLYTLISGGLTVVFGVGHGVAFPTQSALGPHCYTWLGPIRQWSTQAHALTPTLRFGYLGWLALLVGVVAVLRASGRGRTGWEPLTLLLIACTPPVFMCLQYLFHPQDLLAMGLGLCGVALGLRDRWALAGFAMALALASQQFAILVFVVLLVVAPPAGRLKMVAVTVVTWLVIVLPLALVTSGRALRVALVGSGLAGAQANSLAWELHLTSSGAVQVWRLLPVLISAALAYWSVRRLGPAALNPVNLLSLVATALSLRLVFETGLYGYYFMAVAVSLIILDVLRRRFRIELVGWLALIVLVFDPLPWGYDRLTYAIPMWIWQVLLVSPAVWLSLSPLKDAIRGVTKTTQKARTPLPSGTTVTDGVS